MMGVRLYPAVVGALLLLRVASPGPATAGEDLWSLQGTIYVTNRTLNSVAAYHAGTGAVKALAAVGQRPIGVLATPGTDKIYVSDEGSSTVSVLSASGLRLLRTIPIGPMPHHMMHDPSGRYVYVAEFGSNQVGVIDTRTDERVKGLVAGSTAAARTHAAWPTADGKVYAANERTNELSVVDAASGQLLWTLPVGNRPSEVLVTPDGRTAYVSVRNEDKIKVIDVQARRITGEAVIGIQPDTLALTPDGRTLIVGLRGIPAQVAFMDTASLRVTWVEAGGTTTGHQWLSTDGRFTFIALEGPGDLGSVAVIDNIRRRLRTAYPYPGGGRPHGVYYRPGP